MTTKFRRPMLVLGTTILIMQAVFMPIGMVYAETTMDTEEQEQVERPPMKNYLEEEQASDPRFFFSRSRMHGTAEEPLQVTFFSDQEVSEASVFLPEEATLLKDQLPTGLSVEEGAQSNEWIVQSKRAQHTFVLPLVVEKAGNYQLSAEETTAHLEISEKEEASEEVPVEETESSDEDEAGQEELKEENGIDEAQENEQPAEEVREPVSEAPQEQQTDEEENDETSQVVEPTVFDGETAEVATMAEFREAVGNPDIGIISVQANLTEATANVLTVDRPLLIQGNGYTLTFGINGFYFQLEEVTQASTIRIENATLTKVGGTPLINATVESSKNWTVELEDITEVNANTMRLASLPEGSIHFTGGVSNFTRIDSAETFIEAKEILATNQAEVIINRGDTTVFFSSATVSNPKIMVEQGAKVTITTTVGVANTIDLIGGNPELILQSSGQLNITTVGTTAIPTEATNNAIALTGNTPKITMKSSAQMTVKSTLSKRAIYLLGNNAQLNVDSSELNVSSESQTAIDIRGNSAVISLNHSSSTINSTSGIRININGENPILTSIKSELSMNSASGGGIIFQGDEPEVHLDDSDFEIENSGNGYGFSLNGSDALLSAKNNSTVNVSSSGTGLTSNIRIGNNQARPQILLDNKSKLNVTTSSSPFNGGATENAAINLHGESPTAFVSEGSELNVNVIQGTRTAILLTGNKADFNINDSTVGINNPIGDAIRIRSDFASLNASGSELKIEKNSGTVIDMMGIETKLILNNSVLDSNLRDGRGIFLRGNSPQLVLYESSINIVSTSGLNPQIELNGPDALLSLTEKSVISLEDHRTGSNENIVIGNGNLNPIVNIKKGSQIIINSESSGGVFATPTSNNALRIDGREAQLEISDSSSLYISLRNGSKRGVAVLGDGNNVLIEESSSVTLFVDIANGFEQAGSDTSFEIDSNSDVIISTSIHGHNDSAGFFLGNRDETSINGSLKVTNRSRLSISSVSSSALTLLSEGSNLFIESGSEVSLITSNSDGQFSPLRFRTFGNYLFQIEHASMIISKFAGTAPAVRMYGGNNEVRLNEGAKFYVTNQGNGIPHDGSVASGGNIGILYTNGGGIFSISGKGAEARIRSFNGPAIDMGNNAGKIEVTNGGYFEATGQTATSTGGIFRAGSLNVTFDNPLYMNFANTRSGGGNIFTVENTSSLIATNSDLAVWKDGDNLEGDPDQNYPSLDFSFSGQNFNTLESSSNPEILNASTLGKTGLTEYSRLSSNNARWVIADMLRVPTNADKKIHGRVVHPVGIEGVRPTWDNEATVTVEVESPSGETKKEYTTKTVGITNESPGISIYGEAPQGGLFEIELEEPLEAGSKVRIIKVELTSGKLTEGFEHQILTDTVEVFPIIPPNPAQFSSSMITKGNTTIRGFTDTQGVEVTAKHNGESFNTENVVIDTDGNFTLDLSMLTLEKGDKIQVFLRDEEGSAKESGVSNPPETNNDRGNINPAKEMAFHDAIFEAATTLIVEDIGPVSPVDPLYPEAEVNPENKPELPENQGALSLDFVSSFNFDEQAISAQNQLYYAKQQRLLNEDGTVNEKENRPNYVQISDRRSENERNGWELAVTQREQFKGKENQVLNGASLSLSNQQIISAQGGTAPVIQSDPCTLLVPGNRRTLLKAQGSEGTGTWIYRFGDGETAGESVMLDVPKGSNPEATTYSTTLIWELSAVPNN